MNCQSLVFRVLHAEGFGVEKTLLFSSLGQLFFKLALKLKPQRTSLDNRNLIYVINESFCLRYIPTSMESKLHRS